MEYKFKTSKIFSYEDKQNFHLGLKLETNDILDIDMIYDVRKVETKNHENMFKILTKETMLLVEIDSISLQDISNILEVRKDLMKNEQIKL